MFNQLIIYINSLENYTAEAWEHPTTGESRIKVTYQDKFAGFIINPEAPKFENSFKKVARFEIPTFEVSEISTPEIQNQEIQELEINKNEHDVANLINHNIYLIDISVKGSVSAVPIEWKNLGLDDDLVNTLMASKAVNVKLPLMAMLNKKVNKIRNERTRIYSKFLIRSAPFWYCLESKIDEFLTEFEELEKLAQSFRDTILYSYSFESHLFLNNVMNILDKTEIEQDKKDYILGIYKTKIPTKQEIFRRFDVSLTTFVKVPNLLEQVKNDTEKNKTLADNLESRAKKKYAEQILKNVESAAKETSEEFIEIIANTLERITAMSNTEASKEQCQKALERIEILSEFNKVYEGVHESFSELVTYHRNENNIKMHESLKKIRATMKDLNGKLEPENNPIQNHKSLVKFMM